MVALTIPVVALVVLMVTLTISAVAVTPWWL